MAYIGNPILTTDYPVNTFSGNGSTTAFTLSLAPASVNSILVAVSGVIQDPSTYTVSGTTLTFTAAPPSGTNNISVRHLGIAGIPNTPSAGSVQYSSLNSSLQGTLVGKNRIINGAMVIDQRNAGASVTVNSAAAFYATDRFRLSGEASDGVFTGQQISDAPTGFVNSLRVTTTTADASIGAGQVYYAVQNIEGFNTADLMWGTANAKTVTLSFWTKSSLTGTFGGAFSNSAVDRSYPFTYTISSANTWEYKTITIAGDTTGTWLTNNGTGIRVYWGLGAGSNFTSTAGSWVAAQRISATGAVSVIGTLNATWQITGVQLEVGSTATSFDYRPYGTELALCQRYYQKTDVLGTGIANTTTTVAFITNYLQPMRATPTGSVAGTIWNISDNYLSDFDAASPSIGTVYASTATSYRYRLDGFTGLTTGRWYGYRPSAISLIAFSAEL